MKVSVAAWSAFLAGVALAAYGLVLFGVASSDSEGARESMEAMSWRSRRTRGAVLFLMGSGLSVGALIVLLELG